MEYLKTYYSLEKHLEETIKFNPQFEILNSIWKLNKKNLSGALSNVNQYYPHYSLHDRSHSATIINNIELFLGEDRIKQLSPTNTWLLLMASFTHDLGMVIFQDVIENEWESIDFQGFLNDLAGWDDPDLEKNAKILCSLKSKHEVEFTPIEIKNAVTIVVAEYMRRIHHKRSSDMLKGIDKTFNDVAKAFYSDQIPNRLLSLLGDIAYLHGVEFYDIFKKLEFESNGISNDKINPRFIAAMLRLGDLLDIDDGRFNQFTTNVFKSPISSIGHQKKHSSIKHFLITPEAIEITADCFEDDVYRLARSWFDWLEIEVENLNKEWSNIAPSDLGGSAPRIPKGKIKVFSKGSTIDERFLNLRFQVSNQKIFEILEGGSIYEKAEFTFLRELVQNALDATKIQLWKEIQRGTYDFAFRKLFNDYKLTHSEIISKIQFPNDLPEDILSSYRINLNVFWEDIETQKNLIIEVIDEGTGISGEDILRMTEKVGESRKINKSYIDFLDSMPFWLRPTAAFGIGLQSLFIIVDSFSVHTKFEGEIGKEITFRTAKKGKYSSVLENAKLTERGTKVSLKIPEEKFEEVFGTSFDWNIISSYDHFTDDYGNIYIHKIKNYVLEVLSRVKNLDETFFGKKLTEKKDLNEIQSINDNPLSNENISINLYVSEGNVYFHFFEKIIGSEFFLKFFSKEGQDLSNNWTLYQTDFFVRDIPVKSNLIKYSVLSYSKLFWNFMSPQSDKILSITREKFIKKYKREIEIKFQRDVLKEALTLATEFLNKDYTNKIKAKFAKSEEKLAYIYFKIILTFKANGIELKYLDETLLRYDINPEFASLFNDEKVTYNEFFTHNEVLIPISNDYGVTDGNNKINKKSLISPLDLPHNKLIIWLPSFFPLFLRMNYQIKEIRYYQNGHILFLRQTKTDSDSIKIDVGEEFYYSNFTKNNSLVERNWNYSIEKYSKILNVYNEYGSGFENFPYLSTTSIISPFASNEKFERFYSELKLTKYEYSLVDIKSIIYNINIRRFVTQSLIDWIKKYNPDKSSELSDEIIEQTYRDLIAEIVYYRFKRADKQ